MLPPTSNIKTPNSAWKRETSPFVFLDEARPWAAESRVAAVSAFGFGGTNSPRRCLASHHGAAMGGAAGRRLDLGAVPVPRRRSRGGARDRGAARQARGRDAAPARPRADGVRAGRGPVQLAIVADSTDDLRDKLARRAPARPARASCSQAPVVAADQLALLCPGQGSQKVGMLRRAVRRSSRGCTASCEARRGVDAGKLYPAAAYTPAERTAQTEALTDTRVAQPALGIVDLAAAELLAALGVRPDLVAGHSYGELAALAVAGAIGEADLLALSQARGEAILAAAAALGRPGHDGGGRGGTRRSSSRSCAARAS